MRDQRKYYLDHKEHIDAYKKQYYRENNAFRTPMFFVEDYGAEMIEVTACGDTERSYIPGLKTNWKQIELERFKKDYRCNYCGIAELSNTGTCSHCGATK